jgi:hypothetical protein
MFLMASPMALYRPASDYIHSLNQVSKMEKQQQESQR